MFPVGPSRFRRAVAQVVGLVAIAVSLAACGTISRTPPVPGPASFPEIAAILTRQGIQVTSIVSGDAGCQDANLAKTAIGFDASGIDQTGALRLHIFIFRNRAAYDRLRPSIDQCAASFVTDPETFESVETSPYVVAGQGPWAPSFKDALRAAIVEAAGTGD